MPPNRSTLAYFLDNKPQEFIQFIENSQSYSASYERSIRQFKKYQKESVSKYEDEVKSLHETIPEASRRSTLEEFKNNLEKLIKISVFSDKTDQKELLREAKKQYDEGNEEEFNKLKEKIDNISRPSETKLSRDKELRALYRWYSSIPSDSDKFVLVFKNSEKINENKKEFQKNIENFAKNIKGKVKNNTIVTPFSKSSSFISFMVGLPEGDKIKQSYAMIAQYKPDLKGSEERISALSEADKLFFEDKKYTVDKFTPLKVMKYLTVATKIGGDVKSLIPKKLPNGNVFPSEIIFLRKESDSMNSLPLSPYGNILINSSFSESEWYSVFSKTLRQNSFFSEKVASLRIIDSIIEGLSLNLDSSKVGNVNLIPFRNLKIPSDMVKARKVVRKYINNDTDLSTSIKSKSLGYQKDYFQSNFESRFTIKEAKAFENWFNQTDEEELQETLFDFYDEDEPETELDITYYDESNNVTSSSIGAISAKIEINGFDESPDSLRGKLRELTRTVSATDTGKGIESEKEKIKSLKEQIQRRKESGESLTNLEEVLESREQKLKEMEESKTDEDLYSQVDINELRNVLSGSTDFTDFILAIGDELEEMINVDADFAFAQSDKLSDKNTVYALVRLSDVLGKGIRESFMEIIKEENTNEKQNKATALEKEIGQMLPEAKTQLIESFSLRLEELLARPFDFFTADKTGTKAGLAIKEFNKVGLAKEA